MAFCVYCGTKLAEGNRFCAGCGKPVPSAAPKAAPPAPPEEPVFPAHRQVSAPPAAAEKEEEFFSAFSGSRQTAPEAAAPAPEPTAAAPIFHDFPVSFDFSQDPVAQEPSSFDPRKVPEDYAVYAAPVFRQDATSFPPLRDTPQQPKAPTYAEKHVAKQAPATQAQPQSRGTLRIVASVLICVLLLTAMVPFFALLTLQNTLHSDTLVSLFQRVELDRIPMGQLDVYFDGSLADLICEEVNEVISDTVRSENWAQFTPATLQKFLQETTFPAFIAEHLEGLLRALLTGKDSYSISTGDVEELLLDNMDFITNDLDLLMDEDQIHIAARQFVNAGGLEDIPLPQVDAGMQDALTVARLAISTQALLPVIITLVVLVAFLFLINLKQPLYALRDMGIVCVVGTVLPLLTILGVRSFVAQKAGADAIMYIVGLVISCILERGLIFYIISFGAGAVILIVFGILQATRKKRLS